MPIDSIDEQKPRVGRKLLWWKIAFSTAAVLGVAGTFTLEWAIKHVLPYAVVGTNRSQRFVMYRGVTPESLGVRADAFVCEVEPGLHLKGWFVHAIGTPRGTVVLLHGHNSCKEAMLNLAKLFSKEGFNALAYDSRGDGESEGRFCTFGYYEHRDCSKCLDELLSKYGQVIGPTAIYGASFGGAVALQTMAHDSRFQCGIVESTFATLREIVQDYEQHITGWRFERITNRALDRAGVLARFPPDAVEPETAALAIRRPVLMIHGTADREISIRYGERIFRNLGAARGSEWMPIAGAGHGNLWQVGGDAYRKHVVDFLVRNEQ